TKSLFSPQSDHKLYNLERGKKIIKNNNKKNNNKNQTQGGERSTGKCSLEFKPYAHVPFLCPSGTLALAHTHTAPGTGHGAGCSAVCSHDLGCCIWKSFGIFGWLKSWPG
ncbi:hypothetical protein CIB84_014206, partial [Bambusicola thoracicus]